MTRKPSTLRQRIEREIADDIDEEFEMEMDDDRLDKLLAEADDHQAGEGLDRRVYFKELLRLQGELIKLQDWVASNKQKVVVLFEGRDAAGKGGVIKRITQRLNPRICRVAALPAPNERERTQWYFQRYVAHLPAGGEIVLFDRSWYNRAGVERVMGFCTEEQVQEFFRSVPEFEHMLVRSGTILLKYWFSITDDEQQFRFMMRIQRSAQAVEAVADGRRIAQALGAVHQGQGRDAGEDAHQVRAVVDRRCGRQEARAAELHQPPADADSVPGGHSIRRWCCRSACAIRTISRGPVPKEMYVPGGVLIRNTNQREPIFDALRRDRGPRPARGSCRRRCCA